MVGVTGSIPVAPTIDTSEKSAQLANCEGDETASRCLNKPRTVPSCPAEMGKSWAEGSRKVLRGRLEALRPFFYSPYDFGDGLTTRRPRTHRRFRRRLRLLKIPEDLSGKTVLDIGAYVGFFSFEFERR